MALFAQALINGITDGVFLAMMALGITLVFGVARFPNVAHGDFLTVGAYGAYWCTTLLHLSLPLAAIGGTVLSIAAGLLAYALVFRKISNKPITALLVSIGLSIFIRGLLSFVAGNQQVSYDMPLWRAWRWGGIRVLPSELAIAAASVAVILAAHLILKYTRIGIEMRAVSDNPDLARTGGIDPGRVNRATWSIALGVAGLAGMFVAAKTAISPDMGWNLLLPAFAAAVLGGLGSPYGAIFAGLLIGIAQNVATLWISDTYKISFAFLILIATLLIKPSGLTGKGEAAR
jgi:branched-chain amino acid transport system permease protein